MFLLLGAFKVEKMQGTIKTIVEGKGFGFISRPEGGKDIFFHAKNLRGVAFEDLRAGDTVSFGLEYGEKGPYAVGVERV